LKLSIEPDYTIRGYGFVTFKEKESVLKLLAENLDNYLVCPYNPKDRRESRKVFNNIYVKNYPESWDDV